MPAVWFPYHFRIDSVWKEYGNSMRRVCRQYGEGIRKVWKQYSCSIPDVCLQYQDSIYRSSGKYQACTKKKAGAVCENNYLANPNVNINYNTWQSMRLLQTFHIELSLNCQP